MMDEKKALLEAALFIAEDPMETDDIAAILNVGSKGFVQQVIDELREDLQDDKRGLEIIETELGYRMQVKKEFIEEIKHLAQHQDMSDAALRTLSLVAYNAPVKQNKIIEIRGNRAYSQIRDLENRGLIQSEKDGRTKVLDVTDEFLDYFGLENIEEFRRQADADPASEFFEEDQEELEEIDEPSEESETEEEGEEAKEEDDSDLIEQEPLTEEDDEDDTDTAETEDEEDEDDGSLISPPTKSGD
jgi:segregation and condensation protein B